MSTIKDPAAITRAADGYCGGLITYTNTPPRGTSNVVNPTKIVQDTVYAQSPVSIDEVADKLRQVWLYRADLSLDWWALACDSVEFDVVVTVQHNVSIGTSVPFWLIELIPYLEMGKKELAEKINRAQRILNAMRQ